LQTYDAALVHTFPNATGLLGIAETHPDIFYVIASNYSLYTSAPVKGTGSVWRVNMTAFSPRLHNGPDVTKIAEFPDSILLNGMISLDRDAGILLLADSGAGVIWKLNENTGVVVLIIDDPLMKPVTEAPLGANGLKLHDGSLYFTNSGRSIVGRVPIQPDGSAADNASIVVSGMYGDDFTFGARGDLFIADALGTLDFVGPHGSSGAVLAGNANSSALAGPSACRFGRTTLDEGSLYISTTGGDSQYASRDYTLGGSISRVDVLL